jgi:hypothetical protein
MPLYTSEELDELRDLVANEVACGFPWQYSKPGDYQREFASTLQMHMLNQTPLAELRERVKAKQAEDAIDRPWRDAYEAKRQQEEAEFWRQRDLQRRPWYVRFRDGFRDFLQEAF